MGIIGMTAAMSIYPTDRHNRKIKGTVHFNIDQY